jgi:hypothetical protein
VWPGRLGGIDVFYVGDGGTRIGVEAKVWDVADSLYDLLKLAAYAARNGRYRILRGRGSIPRLAVVQRDPGSLRRAAR